ncbi:MAG: hypothetical protein FJ333_08490 [Sphingomonadales bacterium]|nr:hypothetical protein [Sphingomonadales bacterium]
MAMTDAVSLGLIALGILSAIGFGSMPFSLFGLGGATGVLEPSLMPGAPGRPGLPPLGLGATGIDGATGGTAGMGGSPGNGRSLVPLLPCS